ncbi:MAG: SDR family oxidoreductase [Bacteroidota bacterium]
MDKLKNKVALITGANSGIGLATARLFTEEGAKVVITGRRQEALDEAARIIGGNVKVILADATDIARTKEVIKESVDAFGHIDILFANAGVANFTLHEDITEEIFDSQFNTNVKGPFFLIKEAIPYLNDGAVIITNTSISSTKGFPASSVYSATKAALRSLSRVLANELKDRQIRTVSIAPGPVKTQIYNKLGLPEELVEEVEANLVEQVPLGRFGTLNELAKSVLYLASEDASFVNGIELNVDGGLTQV